MEESPEQLRPFAVITNADSYVGLELARRFAGQGYDLLIASNAEAILDVQDELEHFGTDVECIKVNLGTYKGVELLADAIQSLRRPIDALVINSSTIDGGPFLDTELKEEINLINQNIISVIHLTKNLLGGMYDQGTSKILFVAPASHDVVSIAARSFLKSFADSIRLEAKIHGVSVTMLMPDSDSDFAEVARVGFEGFISGTETVFANSFKTKIQDWASKVLPERFKASYHRKYVEPHA